MKKNIIQFILVLTMLIPISNVLGDSMFRSGGYTDKVLEKEHPKIDLDSFFSTKKLGSFIEEGKTVFRIFTPNAKKVVLCTFEKPEDETGSEYVLVKDSDGVWETNLDGELNGIYYGYKVFHENRSDDENNILCIDPYAKAVTTFNTYRNPRKSIVWEKEFDWEGDQWIQRDWRDLIIYEMHVRDMTKHKSSGAEKPGTYLGLVEEGKTGGIDYIKSLGVNTVEILPAQEFGNIEIPFEDSLSGKYNTWNPYERNHWGYMTAAYFAPEAYYSENWDTLKWNEWMGKSGKQVNDFKQMVKSFHKKGIAVMMDVVYNHLSEYEVGNLKQIDKEYYFRLDKNGNFIAQSFCGNDLKTERPMMRRLIVESILYWMTEYHVDGFRFDLGKLIDWETIEEIIREAKKINPNAVFVCEPWGGGYDPQGFSQRGWGAWNDQIRNGIKGENPKTGLGWIFGKWYGNNDIERIKSYVNGTLSVDELGLFEKKEHAVNYLASHDGYTLGDFIRIGTGSVKPDEVIKDLTANMKLTPLQLKHNKLAALFLLTSQGMTMIHSGQEFARSKVIPTDIEVKDKHKGMIDHNSYEKDNETNFINYFHADLNNDLLDYYKGLIKLRTTNEAFRRAEYDEIKFHEQIDNKFAFAYTLEHNGERFFVMFNANQSLSSTFELPSGEWEILVDENSSGTEIINVVKGVYKVPKISGAVLRKVK